MRVKNLLLAIALLVTLAPGISKAKDYRASLAQMPVAAESPEKGVLVDLVKAIAKQEGVNIAIEVVPFARSIENVINGKADFHMPMIGPKNHDDAKAGYALSTPTLWHVNFVLYANKDKTLERKKMGSYKLETDRAHVGYFDFPIEPSSSIETSLKKVDAGRIDGFIFADSVTDEVLKKLALKNIKRSLFWVYDVKIVLPKGGKGGETDRFLTRAIEKLKTSKALEPLIAPVNIVYDDWQP